MSRLLDKIDNPTDLKGLTQQELKQLASEIRQELVARVTANGGHLASNLGVVELTIALHRVFDSPRDKIIWDVGHQSYVHKLLTGRRQHFASLRQYGGYPVLLAVVRVSTTHLALVTLAPRFRLPLVWLLPATFLVITTM